VRSDRERRRAEREVRRALSERRAVGTMVAAAACAHLFWFAVLAGDLRLAVVAGALGCVAFVAMSAHIEPAPPAGPRGEIARMSEPEFDRLLWAVERHGSDIATPGPAAAVDSFECLVREALDELPGFVRAELEQHVAVTVAIRMDRTSVTELAFGFVPSSLFPPICGLPGKSIPIVVEPVVLPEPARPADAPAAPSTPRPEPVLPDKQPAGS